jgi:hypothetical protein
MLYDPYLYMYRVSHSTIMSPIACAFANVTCVMTQHLVAVHLRRHSGLRMMSHEAGIGIAKLGIFLFICYSQLYRKVDEFEDTCGPKRDRMPYIKPGYFTSQDTLQGEIDLGKYSVA